MCPKQTPHPGLKFGKICGTKKTHEPDTRDLTGHHGNVFAGKMTEFASNKWHTTKHGYG